MSGAANQTIVHGSSVAVAGQGALILGPSGAGKSALALRLMALGATLIADDRSVLTLKGNEVQASAPEAIKGKIEARGIGILEVPYADSATLGLVIDMSQVSTDRLPPARHHSLLGVELPCLWRVDHGHFPDAILLYLRHLAIQRG